VALAGHNMANQARVVLVQNSDIYHQSLIWYF
jgi:hypothetical protein